MTIYYVDPVLGANTNNGLTWATAWHWLPGNGTALLPGDEVRFAKTVAKTATVAATQAASSHTAPASNHVAVTTTSAAWTAAGVSGITATTDGISLSAGAVAPANTKLAYRAVAVTNSSHFGCINQLFAGSGLTGGANIRIAVCSDALGNTPILYLDGTLPSSLIASGGSTVLRHHNGGVAYSVTGASLALYSSTGFTNSTGLAKVITAGLHFLFTPNQTGSEFISPGSYVLLPNVVPKFSNSSVPYGRTPISYSALVATTYPSAMTFAPSGTLAATFYPQVAQLTSQDMAAPLTFSGVSLRGGFDTTTNLQDGYSNVTPALCEATDSMAAFRFTEGGQNLVLENFLNTTMPLVQWGYAVGTVASLVIRRSALRAVCGPAGSAITLTTYQVVDSHIVQCIPVVSADSTSRTHTCGTWTFTDCLTASNSVPAAAAPRVADRWEFVGTTQARSLLFFSSSLWLAEGSTGQLRFYNTSFGGTTPKLYGAASAGSNNSLVRLVFDKVRFVTINSYVTYVQAQAHSFPFVDLNDVESDGDVSTDYASLRILPETNAPAWFVGAGGVVRVTGKLQATSTALAIGVIRVADFLASGLTTAGVYRPVILLENCRSAVIDGGQWRNVYVNLWSQTYLPVNLPRTGVTIQNATVASLTITAPDPSWVKVIGCTLYSMATAPPSPYNGTLGNVGSDTTNYHSLLATFYGCTYSDLVGDVSNCLLPLNTSFGAPHATTYWFGTKGKVTGSWGNINNGPRDLHMDPDVLADAGAMSLTNNTGSYTSGPTMVRYGLSVFRVGTNGYSYTSPSLNVHGQHDVSFYGTVEVADVYVLSGQNATFSGILDTSTSVRCAVIVPPTASYNPGDVKAHVSAWTTSVAGDQSFSFTVAPTTSGYLRVMLRVSSFSVLKKFQVTVS